MAAFKPGQRITIKVYNLTGCVGRYQIRTAAQILNVIQPPPDMVFLYNGTKIKPEDTPESLEMEDGDMVDLVHSSQRYVE